MTLEGGEEFGGGRTSHVEARHREISLPTQQFLGEVLDAVAHRGHGVRIHIVEAGHGGVGPNGRTPAGATVEPAAGADDRGRCVKTPGAGFVVGRGRDEDLERVVGLAVRGRGEGVVQDADVLFGPAVVIGQDDVDGLRGARCGEEEEEDGGQQGRTAQFAVCWHCGKKAPGGRGDRLFGFFQVCLGRMEF